MTNPGENSWVGTYIHMGTSTAVRAELLAYRLDLTDKILGNYAIRRMAQVYKEDLDPLECIEIINEVVEKGKALLSPVGYAHNTSGNISELYMDIAETRMMDPSISPPHLYYERGFDGPDRWPFERSRRVEVCLRPETRDILYRFSARLELGNTDTGKEQLVLAAAGMIVCLNELETQLVEGVNPETVAGLVTS